MRFGEGLLRSSGHELVTLVAFEKRRPPLGKLRRDHTRSMPRGESTSLAPSNLRNILTAS